MEATESTCEPGLVPGFRECSPGPAEQGIHEVQALSEMCPPLAWRRLRRISR
jgi:hypothetical protein